MSIKNSKDRFSMHIAAAYSYIGDIRRYNMDYNNRLKEFFSQYLFMSTISYCEEGINLLKEINDKYQIDIINTFARRE